jgi:hypothetical protein
MCVVSNITKSAGDIFPNWKQWQQPDTTPRHSPIMPTPINAPAELQLTEGEIKKIRAFLKLIEEAKAFDTMTGQKDCEVAEKTQLIQALMDRIAHLQAKIARILAVANGATP